MDSTIHTTAALLFLVRFRPWIPEVESGLQLPSHITHRQDHRTHQKKSVQRSRPYGAVCQRYCVIGIGRDGPDNTHCPDLTKYVERIFFYGSERPRSGEKHSV